MNDPDTYWHIGAGRWIVEHRAVPTVDPFSNSVTGTPWVPHEWLAEVILAETHRWLGWAGIVALTALSASLSLAVFTAFVTKWLKLIHAIPVIGLGFLLLTPHLSARPQILAMPLMIAFIGGLVVARERQKAPSPWLLPIIWMWVNLHGTFSLGLGFAAFFAVEVLLQEGWKAARQWLKFVAMALVVVLITPNGIKGVLILGTYIQDISFMLSVIGEWRSPDFQQFQPLEAWLLVFLLLVLSLGIRVPLLRSIILLGLLHLALKHVRNVELVGFLAPLVLLPAIGPQIHAALEHNAQSRWRTWLPAFTGDKGDLVISLRTLAGMIILTVASFAYFLTNDHGRRDDAVTPATAIAAAKAHGANGRLFNSYNFGGYLIYAGIPPFVDGRGEMYGDSFIKRTFEAEDSADLSAFERFVTEYDFQWAIIRPRIAADMKFSLLPGWSKVYGDDFAVAYVRNPSTVEHPE